jgi:hypothetical protein
MHFEYIGVAIWLLFIFRLTNCNLDGVEIKLSTYMNLDGVHIQLIILSIVVFFSLNLGSVWSGGFGEEGRGGDILNFYVWFNFLTRRGKGRSNLLFCLNLINSK